MEEDTEYVKLPIEDRCQHKLWKARIHGYEEAKKVFSQINDEKSPEWNKFLGLIKKFVVDSNAVAQEKGLEAAMIYIENCAVAGKTVGEVMSGVITKCVAAPKAKTKDLAVQIALMYIEIEKHEAVLEELLKGTEQKNPKIVSACIVIITQALREFGINVINVKPLLKRVPVLLEDRDKGVRDEGKAMVIEIFRWIGIAIKPQLSSLKPVQVTELEAEFDKLKSEKAVPTRFLRSQQAKQAKLAAEAEANGEVGDEEDCEDGGAVAERDPYEFMDPVDILAKLPKDFHDKVEAKKWQERKEALDALEQLLTTSPKLENGDYGDVVRALKKIIGKDSNVVVVTLAVKCLGGIATGLKKRFQPYAVACVSTLLEKFREKKPTVVTALRDALDALYISITLDTIQEDILAALENKNPSVKAETASFLARCFTRCTPVTLNKKLLKAFCAVLIKTLSESDPSVRDASAEALGTAMKVVGEKGMGPFLMDVDTLKMTKIKEAFDKAELVVKQPKAVAKPERPLTAPAKVTAGSTAPRPVKKPTSTGIKKAPSSSDIRKKPASSSAGTKAKTTFTSQEREMSPEEVDEKAETIFPAEMLSGLTDANWKTRLTSVEQFIQFLGTLNTTEVQSQVLLKTINKKPGLKDTNFQVAKLRLEAVKKIAEMFPLSSTIALCVANEVAEKLGDSKTSSAAADALTALSEATKLDTISTQVLDYAFTQKNPKVQVEVLNWLSIAIIEFGFVVQPKALMDNVKKAVTATNPTIRTAGISLLGTLYIYMGPQLMILFENEKPALVQQINAEFEKHAGEKPAESIRGAKQKTKPKASELKKVDPDVEDDTRDEEAESDQINIMEVMPRVDISINITDALVAELSDKNWKTRAEAVQKIQNMVNESKLITGNLGEAPTELAARLVDSNSKIAANTMALCQSLATAMGPACRQHVRTFFPGFLQGLGDSKTWVRSAAITCINTWTDLCGYKEVFEGEMIADALKSGSPTSRIELWSWLAKILPNIPVKSIPKDEVLACIGTLFANLEDRNADVRKNASEAVLGVMMHVGYGPMSSACEKLKPGSQSVIKAILDNARGSLPEKPAPKTKSAQAGNAEKSGRTVKMAPGSSATITKSKPKQPASNTKGKTITRKKDEDVDTSPLLEVNKLKNQRSIDEQKLKTLKWNFVTPREEFVDLLREQMTTANVNKGLIANMFHVDFKYHLRAIDALNEDLITNSAALMANLDLILRWMTLRFFDTNPSVLLKGLEYLHIVFNVLIEDNYVMLENEASSFIPYLILKVGDPKDTVRNSVKELFKLIGSVYSITRLFAYLMDGIKSKNARQRTECLEQLGWLIETYGLSVCHPTTPAALKEIAKQISDRDNSVRNAALNCVVAAYFLEGERVLKMVGQISDKDMSLLEERIKRAAKNKPIANVRPMQTQPTPAPKQEHREHVTPSPPEQEVQEEEEELPPLQPLPSSRNALYISGKQNDDSENDEEYLLYDQSDETDNAYEGASDISSEYPQTPVSGPYGLNPEVLENIESINVQYSAPKLAEFDLAFLNEPCSQSIQRLPPTTTFTLSPMSNMSQHLLKNNLTQIASSDVEKGIKALNEIETVLTSDQYMRLQGHEDDLVKQLVNQLNLLNHSNHPDVVNCYKNNFNLFMKFYQHADLCYKVKEETLRRALEMLLSLLAEQKLEMIDHTDMFVRVVNNIVILMLEKSNHSATICCLIKILYDTINNTAVSTHFQELTMKCVWKLIKYFNEWSHEELDYDLILVDIHAFFRDFPSSWWKKQPADVPLRTVKTVLHSMVKLRGPDIINNVKTVRGITPDSELWTYVQKLLRHLRVANVADDHDRKESHSQAKKSPPIRLSKATQDQLSDIFRKIGNKQETQEGLRLLYDFKQRYPETDVQPHLEKTNQFFRDYIERGLDSIAAERKAEELQKSNQTIDTRENVDPVDNEDIEATQFLNRLRALQAKAGWNNIPAATTLPTTIPLGAQSLPSTNIRISNDETSGNNIDVEKIKERLAKIKGTR
uniref:TOG domain-containing protein n=1 Tax=Clastoptera arizonana TaxID=38151 RepID=A0A1B6CWX2_9HEMI